MPNSPHEKYLLNYYEEKKMAYLTFYKSVQNENQILFQNRFFHDNTERFLIKLTETLTSMIVQADSYRFMYCNCSTGVGKNTLNIKNKEMNGVVGKLFNHLINAV